MPTMKISKLDAAKRQLDCAIRLWFAEDDPVVIHALTCAAYEIVQDINAKKGDTSLTLIELTRSVIKPEYVAEAMQAIKQPMNFFKHANRDPYGILEFNPEVSEGFMAIAIRGLQDLGEQLSDHQTSFLIWCLFHKPSHFPKGQQFINDMGPGELELFRSIKKADFLKAALKNIVQQRHRG